MQCMNSSKAATDSAEIQRDLRYRCNTNSITYWQRNLKYDIIPR